MTTDRTKVKAEHPDEPTDGGWGSHFPYSEPGDWVALADVSHGAKALYMVYCGHVNKKKNGWNVWPLETDLANILRVSEKTVRKWIVELEHLGAIRVTEVIDPRNGHKRLVVDVNQAAPPDYDGYTDYTSYYRDKRELKKATEKTLLDAAAASEPRAPAEPPVKSTGGQGEKVPVDHDQAKHEPPVKSTGGQRSKSTAGQGSKSTVEETQGKKRKERTHTPPSAEATSDAPPKAETGVCEPPENNDNPHQREARELLNRAVDRTAAHRMTGTERDTIIDKVADLLARGWKSSLLAAQIGGCVNADTVKVYMHLADRCAQIAAERPDDAAQAQTDLWGTTDTTTGTNKLPEVAPGVYELPNGDRQIRYRSCGGRYCTGGSQGRTGTWRRRINPDTGDATEYCDTEITLADGRTTTCHPDARKEEDAPAAA